MSGDGFSIDMREHGQVVQVITLAHALHLEITTGMKAFRGSALVRTAQEFGFTGRTKIAALAWACDCLLAAGVEPNQRMLATLAEHGYVLTGPGE